MGDVGGFGVTPKVRVGTGNTAKDRQLRLCLMSQQMASLWPWGCLGVSLRGLANMCKDCSRGWWDTPGLTEHLVVPALTQILEYVKVKCRQLCRKKDQRQKAFGGSDDRRPSNVSARLGHQLSHS